MQSKDSIGDNPIIISIGTDIHTTVIYNPPTKEGGMYVVTLQFGSIVMVCSHIHVYSQVEVN